MVHLILHAGMPKTATTTIQSHLHAHRDALLGRKVLYPETGLRQTSRNHQILVDVCEAAAAGTPADETAWHEMRVALAAEIAASGADTVILSNEHIYGILIHDPAALARIRDIVATSRVTVVVAVREQLSHALSGYAQSIKGYRRASRSFAAHVAEREALGTWRYADRLRAAEAVFGPGTVRPYRYEEWKSAPLRPLSMLCEGRLEGLGRLDDRNVTPGWAEIAVRRRINLLYSRAHLVWRGLNRVARGVGALADRIPALNDWFYPVSAAEKARLLALGAGRLAEVEAAFDFGWSRHAATDTTFAPDRPARKAPRAVKAPARAA
jgi:hypothetical protein